MCFQNSLYVFFCHYRSLNSGLALAKHVLYNLSHPLPTQCILLYFSDRIMHLSTGLDHETSIYASWIAGMIGTYQQVQLFIGSVGVLQPFLSGLALN
jgi:hypothetical protein